MNGVTFACLVLLAIDGDSIRRESDRTGRAEAFTPFLTFPASSKSALGLPSFRHFRQYRRPVLYPVARNEVQRSHNERRAQSAMGACTKRGHTSTNGVAA